MIRTLTKGLGNRRPSTGRLGQDVERLAAGHLRSRGVRIISTNYRCRWGEIDIIARHGEVLLFVEVRLRSHRRFASGAESVGAAKQRRLAATASHYLQKAYGDHPPPCRFDVVSVSTGQDDGAYQMEWIQDAFRPGG